MCGIIGVVGRPDAITPILDGLERLEYRGYDSAGVVLHSGRDLRVAKRAGRLSNLRAAIDGQTMVASTGIGHTRWATHGGPTDRNAHPHADPTGKVALVHNGIIENYAELKRKLSDREYLSETDSEVVAHLVAEHYDAMGDAADLPTAVREVVNLLEGAFSLCIVHEDVPDMIVVAKRQSPLVIAYADGVAYCASDVAAMIGTTTSVASLLDDQMAVLTADGIVVTDFAGESAEPHAFEVTWDLSAAERGGYDTFMLKEIHEQPEAVRETLRDRFVDQRLKLDVMNIDEHELGQIDKIFIVGCGTALHAGMVGKYAIEHWAGIPVEIEVASEFRYRDPILDPHTLVIAMSQSGETIDTIQAASHARDQRAKVIALCNVVGSTLAREADGVFYTHAGPEVAVASTKAFTTQMVGTLVLGLYLAQARNKLYASEIGDILERISTLPEQMQEVIDISDAPMKALADQYHDVNYTMFIGRHNGLPIAYEGALKLKEISYLHAEAFPAGEMKHGPIALIEDGSLVVGLAPRGHVFGKIVSNLQEVKARGADVIAIGTQGDEDALRDHADHLIMLPEAAHELATPILSVIPLQLFSYHVATARGNDVDKPRNLAKTVTVE